MRYRQAGTERVVDRSKDDAFQFQNIVELQAYTNAFCSCICVCFHVGYSSVNTACVVFFYYRILYIKFYIDFSVL